jgi:hypothetical protein
MITAACVTLGLPRTGETPNHGYLCACSQAMAPLQPWAAAAAWASMQRRATTRVHTPRPAATLL